jgi:predicted nucleotidyltransferase
MLGYQAEGDDRRELVKPLLERFTADAAGVVPLVALWAHGSLALGDYQPGRSDLDLVALVSEHIGDPRRAELEGIHKALARDEELADKLHCSYVVGSELADPGRSHVTWAMGELYERPVSPISRRELRDGGLCLHGPEPGRMVPAITDQELADYVRANLHDYWYPLTRKPALWLRDIWVDLGMLTLARASVTLRDGRLIGKREALEVLAQLDAPAEVVRDIYRRRYEAAQPISGRWRFQRAHLARTFVQAAIPHVLA